MQNKHYFTGFFFFFLGLYLISPSEFERFSLSARWVVEPQCLVEAPSQTSPTSHPSQTHRDQPDGASTEHRYNSSMWAQLMCSQGGFILKYHFHSVISKDAITLSRRFLFTVSMSLLFQEL